MTNIFLSNNRFCIIIPTYNRSNYLRRILNYYNEYKGDYNIIVADSSSDENKKRNKQIIASFSNVNILHLNKYSSEINPFDKIADATNYVKEKYCVLCADDDFITPNGIKKSVEFLEKNKDYVCAQGNYVSFKFNSENESFFWKPTYLHQKSITSSDPQQRLALHMSNYMQTFYSVHKTKFLKKSFEDVSKYTDDDRFGELLPSMLTLIYGKMKCLDVFYSARENIIDSAGRTSKDLPDFIKEGTYDEKYAKFKNCLAVHLSKNSQIDIEEAEKVIDDSMKLYIDVFTRRHNVLIRKMKEHLDYEIIRELYRKMFRRNDYTAWSNSTPSTEHLEDFNKIKKLVISGR